MFLNELCFLLPVTLMTIKLPSSRRFVFHTVAGCTRGQAKVSSGGSVCRGALLLVAFYIQNLLGGYAHPIALVSYERERHEELDALFSSVFW